MEGVEWQNRDAIPGAVAAPGIRYNLVERGDAAVREPSFEGLQVEYEVGGDTYSWKSDIAFKVREEC